MKNKVMLGFCAHNKIHRPTGNKKTVVSAAGICAPEQYNAVRALSFPVTSGHRGAVDKVATKTPKICYI